MCGININGNKLKTVQLIGGEPTVHPNFLEICDFLGKKGLEIRISTNGISNILHSDEIVKLTRKYKILFRISLDDLDKVVNSYTRGNSYEAVINNIIFLVNNGANVSVKSVITQKNVDKLEDMLRFLSNLGVKQFTYSSLYKVGNASSDIYYNENYVSDLDIYKEIVKINEKNPELLSMLAASVPRFIIEKKFIRKPYYFTKFFLYVNYDGNIYAQDQLPFKEYCIGNIYNLASYEKQIKMLRYFKINKEIFKKSCINCEYNACCVKGNYGELYNIDPTLESRFPTCKDLILLIKEIEDNEETALSILTNMLQSVPNI